MDNMIVILYENEDKNKFEKIIKILDDDFHDMQIIRLSDITNLNNISSIHIIIDNIHDCKKIYDNIVKCHNCMALYIYIFDISVINIDIIDMCKKVCTTFDLSYKKTNEYYIFTYMNIRIPGRIEFSMLIFMTGFEHFSKYINENNKYKELLKQMENKITIIEYN